MAATGLPRFPFPREHGAEPAPLNAKLRREAPISKVQLYDGTSAWLITDHEHCCYALSTDKLSADRRTAGFPEIHEGGHSAKKETPTFVNLDDPEHAKQRSMLQTMFDRETVEKKWRPMMERTIDIVLDKLLQKGVDQQPIDLIEEFAIPVPTQIIYQALGVPAQDVERLSQDSEIRNRTSRDAAESANQSLHKYMQSLVDDKIKQPGDDIISELVIHQYETGILSKEFITKLAFLVLTAGNAALINSIGLGTLTLLEHPEQLRQFKQKTELAPQAVNEISRFHTASALNSRRAMKTDMELGGTQFQKGEGVICAVQAANRDEKKFSDPDKFDIFRNMTFEDSLGFGYGPHRCQAESFARVQLEIVFVKLFQRLPNLRLGMKPEDLPYTEPTMNIGVNKLPVYFE